MGIRPAVKVLLIDDDPEDLELTEDVLRQTTRLRFVPTLESDPAKGLELLCNGSFDIALVDYEMGSTTGLELLASARAKGTKTPFVLLTGHQDNSLAEDALGAGVADYLEKGALDPVLVERVVLYAMERMRVFRELVDTTNRVRFMLDATPGIAWESDSNGNLLYVSRQWIEMVGDGDHSKTLFEAIHEEDLPQAMASWFQSRDSGTEWRSEYRLRLLDGSYRWVLSRASQGDSSFPSSSWIGLSVTVDEQKQLELELQRRVAERTAELEEVQLELQSVSYAMVHDMRSPVRAIIASSTELLEEFPDVPAGLVQGLQRQQMVGRRMHALVDGMIQYIRLIRSSLQPKVLDATQLCREVEAQIRAEGILFGAQVEIHSGMQLTGDPAIVKILIKAILENAAKFRPKDRANFVKISQADATNGLCIEDNGIGFDPAYLDKILLPFERLHREEEFVGVGIGLAIARRAIGRHDGSLTFKAAVGEGVSVCFTLGS